MHATALSVDGFKSILRQQVEKIRAGQGWRYDNEAERGWAFQSIRQLSKKVRSISTTVAAVGMFTASSCVSGCSSVGPEVLTRDRFDYSISVADSWKRQMLLNLVKIRYSDAPTFLDVGQIVSGYTMQSTVTAMGNLFGIQGFSPGTTTSNVGLNAQGQFTDRPTITYTPLVGAQFARAFMTPLPPAAILALVQSGYPIDLVFLATVQQVNDLHNQFGGDYRARPPDPKFYELLKRLRRIQISGAVGLQTGRLDGGSALVMTFQRRSDPEVAADQAAVRRLLGLDPTTSEIKVVYGSAAANNKEIALITRSILDVLIDLASGVTVPEQDVAEHRVSPNQQTEALANGRPVLIRVMSGVVRPADAFTTAVSYRGKWFWIDDQDIPSKRNFAFLMFLFTLVEKTGPTEGAPIVTIPAG